CRRGRHRRGADGRGRGRISESTPEARARPTLRELARSALRAPTEPTLRAPTGSALRRWGKPRRARGGRGRPGPRAPRRRRGAAEGGEPRAGAGAEGAPPALQEV